VKYESPGAPEIRVGGNTYTLDPDGNWIGPGGATATIKPGSAFEYALQALEYARKITATQETLSSIHNSDVEKINNDVNKLQLDVSYLFHNGVGGNGNGGSCIDPQEGMSLVTVSESSAENRLFNIGDAIARTCMQTTWRLDDNIRQLAIGANSLHGTVTQLDQGMADLDSRVEALENGSVEKSNIGCDGLSIESAAGDDNLVYQLKDFGVGGMTSISLVDSLDYYGDDETECDIVVRRKGGRNPVIDYIPWNSTKKFIPEQRFTEYITSKKEDVRRAIDLTGSYAKEATLTPVEGGHQLNIKHAAFLTNQNPQDVSVFIPNAAESCGCEVKTESRVREIVNSVLSDKKFVDTVQSAARSVARRQGYTTTSAVRRIVRGFGYTRCSCGDSDHGYDPYDEDGDGEDDNPDYGGWTGGDDYHISGGGGNGPGCHCGCDNCTGDGYCNCGCHLCQCLHDTSFDESGSIGEGTGCNCDLSGYATTQYVNDRIEAIKFLIDAELGTHYGQPPEPPTFGK